MHSHDDEMAFIDDDVGSSLPDTACSPWQVLIVDDDEDVHQATEFALRDTQVLGRPLSFLHANGTDEALAILARTPDVALILLDVVMETQDAGLQAVQRIRGELGMANVRVILRTGQPGYAPEMEAISRYDINDYKTKAELTRTKLFTTVTSAIRSFDQIQRLDSSRRGLELIIDSTTRFIPEQGMQSFVDDVIIQFSTLLGVAPQGLVVAYQGVPLSDGAEGGKAIVLSAAGRFSGLQGKSVEAVDETAVKNVLTECLQEKNNLISSHHVALYIAGKCGQDFVGYFESTHPLAHVERHLVEVFCANIAICGENVDLVSRLRNTAYVDRLTRLPNRVAQIEAIDRFLSLNTGEGMVVVLADIDQFSETIDILGYRFGDFQLEAIARRLRNSLPTEVYVARIAGDVFSIFGREETVNLEFLREILAAPFEVEGGLQSVSFSLGMVRLGSEGRSGADLLRNAAIALKRAKVDGPGNDAYYTPEVAFQTRDHIRLLQSLRKAFDTRSLFVVYQPQIELSSGRTIGLEALLRWRTEEGEFVPPDRFIPIAEQSGLIISLGNWVLRTALHVRRSLAASGYPLRMAVNVSAIQFRHPQFVDMIDDALHVTGTAPEDLEMEITESVAMFGWNMVSERLQALRQRGIKVAIDDFGTGFSSLSYLDKLPADCLKIDRSFVASLGATESGERIAEMVIQLGRQLGMRVLAEGVESAEQIKRLRWLGCTEAQGWHYAKAMPVEALTVWLAEQTAGVSTRA